MQFLLYLYTLWWFGLHKVYKAMVDFQLNLEGWLEDATLFPTEPNGYNFNLDDLLNCEKANSEVPLNVDLPDLQWLDEKINLSFFEDPKGLLLQPNDTETLMLEDAATLLFDLIENSSDTSRLPSSDPKVELNTDLNVNGSNFLQYPVASPASTDFLIPSPYYESISEASSPASVSSDIPVDGTSYQLCLSPGAVSTHSDTSPVVSVTVCNADSICDPVPVEETLTIEEVTSSVKKRKYVNDGNKVPKVQVSLKNVFHPYCRTPSRRKGDRNERKKVQNKEAAARYRMKKRTEEKELSDVIGDLEVQQKELKSKHDDLFAEIKYLKSLMREMLQKKGLL